VVRGKNGKEERENQNVRKDIHTKSKITNSMVKNEELNLDM
jgi:hypothetical protein